MRKKKILLTTLIVFALLFAIILGLVIYSCVNTNDDLYTEVTNDTFYSSWQQHLKDETPLNEVITPGSHDAGCFKMMPLAETQGHTIIDQLKSGVRYLDLRVDKNKDDLVIFHGPIKGQSFNIVLNDINTFIKENPTEFLVLDFQHLGKDVNQAVIDKIKSTLPMEHALVKSKFPTIETTTFKDLRDNSINFVVVWNNEQECNENDFLYYRDKNLYSYYDGKIHRNNDTNVLINHFDEYYNRYENKGFFVLQSQRTAHVLIAKPGNMEKENKELFNKFLLKIKDNPKLLDKTNIIMRDFIASDINTVNLILNLNLSKNNIKEDSISLFTEKTK